MRESCYGSDTKVGKEVASKLNWFVRKVHSFAVISRYWGNFVFYNSKKFKVYNIKVNGTTIK